MNLKEKFFDLFNLYLEKKNIKTGYLKITEKIITL